MRQLRTRVTLSMRELDRLKCIQAVLDGELSAIRAAERLAMSSRQRLSQVLRVAQEVQAHRENRAIEVPSTAHRADGKRVPRSRLAGSKSQRELGPEDLQQAIEAVHPELLPPYGRQTERRGRRSKREDEKSPNADIST